MNGFRTSVGAACIVVLSAAIGSAGIQSPNAAVEILRDRDGVPHIRAGSEPDALFGLGYVHAQDRLWQLEYLRRVGRGRLSELLGPAAVPTDKLFRTLGVLRSAEATWAGKTGRHRQLILAYVAGINAAAKEQIERGLPAEFHILGFQPERWTPVDVMVSAKVLGWSVDSNWDQEVLRAQIVARLGHAASEALMPAYTADGPVIVPEAGPGKNARRKTGPSGLADSETLARLSEFSRITAEVLQGGRANGSNNQVIASGRSTTGKPILASDPHLPSQIPSIFYRAHLSGGALNAIGTTVVGIPGIAMGHNERIAWGWTNAMIDVQDLFVERINARNEFEYNGQWVPLDIQVETIHVKGQPDVEFAVRSTRHGPIISDVVNPSGPALALRWAALDAADDVGVSAYLDANKASNWQEFTAAFRRHRAHAQNMMYADVDGNIAYALVGAVPVRRNGDGKAPVPGWTSEYEWTGYIPFDELPRSMNPASGALTSANNRIAPETYKYPLSSGYAGPWRALRVREMVDAQHRIAPQDFRQMQMDVLAAHARELMPTLLAVPAVSDIERRAVDLLRTWDLRMTAESPAAAVFAAWYTQLGTSLFADELGEGLWNSYSGEMHMVSMALSSALRSGSPFCDDVSTPSRESCTETASAALRIALRRMTEAQGTDDLRAWQWGKVHHIVFFHPVFDTNSALAPRFNRTAVTSGDKQTVNQASNPRWSEYTQRHYALYRQIIDLSDMDKSTWAASPGQSGRPDSLHYDDLIAGWRTGEYSPMLFSWKAVEQQTSSRISLEPNE